MKGYKGKIAFYKHTESYMQGVICICAVLDGKDYKSYTGASGSLVYAGECEVDVEFVDTRAAEIDSIDAQIKRENAEHQMRLNMLMGRKQELLALEQSS